MPRLVSPKLTGPVSDKNKASFIALALFLLLFLTISFVAPFEDQLLQFLFPKDASRAAVGAGELTAKLVVANTSLTSGGTTTAKVQLLAAENFAFQGAQFSILVPKELQVTNVKDEVGLGTQDTILQMIQEYVNGGGADPGYIPLEVVAYDSTHNEIRATLVDINGRTLSTGSGAVDLLSFTLTASSTPGNYNLKFRNGFPHAVTDGVNNLLDVTSLNTATVSIAAAVTPTNIPTPTPTTGTVTLQTPVVSAVLTPSYGNAGCRDTDAGTACTVQISGTKQTDTAVEVNGVVVVSRNASTTFSTDVTSVLGDNNLQVRVTRGTNVSAPVSVAVRVHGVGDITGDGVVNVFDLGIFAGNYGKTGIGQSSTTNERMSNMNTDTVINVFDLGIFAGKYNSTYTYN